MTTAPARIVDALGTYCPVPIGLIARAAAAVPPGSVILLLADDPLVEVDLPAWCHDRGHELISIESVGGEFRARVRAR